MFKLEVGDRPGVCLSINFYVILMSFLQRLLMFSRFFRSVLEGLLSFISIGAQESLVFSSLASKNCDSVMLQEFLVEFTRFCYSVDKGSFRNKYLLLGDRFRKL